MSQPGGHDRWMRTLRFLVGQFRESRSKRRFVRGLLLGTRGGNLTVNSPDGTSLSVRVSGQGPAVVLVHGALDGMNAFAFVEPALVQGATVWTYDRRGRGGSDDGNSDFAIQREVDDLRAVVGATGDTPHVVGHSYGAVVAMLAALDGVPMRSLVLYEPPMNGDQIPQEIVDEVAQQVASGDRDQAVRTMAGRLAGVSDDELAVALSVPPVRKVLRDGTRSIVRELRALQGVEWSELPIRGIDTLVLQGGRRSSPAYPTDEQAASLARTSVSADLPGQGHLAHTFAPDAFLEIVQPFLAAH